ncbi:Disease resistance protein [Melia azedarach]|uniref:Disease resistance protein n=1 Tax=Melia azedarach TaxID=155640 RepID=A0ACC1YKV4_MELAZ|nr:Disease resistance protein [Melia azedarach]
MADKLSSLFDLECDRLNPHASGFWNNTSLRQLRLKLEEVYDLLHDAERCRSDQNPFPDSWFNDLKDVACDVDELIDECEQSGTSKCKIDREVRRIIGNLVRLLGSFQKFVSDVYEPMISYANLGLPDKSYGLFDIQRYSSKSDIINTMLRSNDDVEEILRIVPIFGEPGIGKTLLAERIYHDEEVKSHFEFRTWVSVGSDLDFLKIVKGIAVEYAKTLSTEFLSMLKLMDVLEEKKVLIVLDDVQSDDDTNLALLKLWLKTHIGGPGSCVLITTRSVDVVNYMGTVTATHLTCYLEEDDSEKDKYGVMAVPQRHSSFVSEHLGLSETYPTSDTESEWAADEDPVSNTEIVAEDEMTFHRETDATAMYNESDLPIMSLKREYLAHRSGSVDIISDAKERMLPGREMESEAAASQSEEGTKPGLDASVKQLVEPVAEVAAMELGSSNITDMKTIHRNAEKVFKYMNDITATKIGVHGMGGIGKTTLLKGLISNSKMKSMFDVIILVTVSRYWSIRKIQNEVLRQLSLCHEDSETDSEVAERLFQVLKGKKFLLLLDDVWEHIDLGEVGIPDPTSENGCKILVASRKLDVCHNMKVVDVETVSWEEAWEIFYEQVGGFIHSPDILPFARAIIKGCGGLPLVIIVSGRALTAENNVSVWDDASRRFSSSSTAGANVVQLLKFSFDQLKDGDTKSCFLHCGLFPEDQEVDIFKFIEYCIQERIITGSRVDAHQRGSSIVNALVRASLLQVTGGGDSIKMHDLIRDLAVGILSAAEGSQFLLGAYSRLTEQAYPEHSFPSRSLPTPESSELIIPEGHQFLFRVGAGLPEPPSEEEWNHSNMIFLMDNKLCTLPRRLNCPKLLMLFLQRNCQLRVIPPSFFDCMASLKVLNLSKTRIKSLPKTFFKLKNLEILILRDCERLAMLPSEVGYLQSLEVLDLGGTEISKLPSEIGKLATLRHLDVSFYGSINYLEYRNLPNELISSGIISRLSALETLSIVVYPGDRRWYENVKFVITEVSDLMKLSSLCFHFPDIELLALFVQSSIAWNAQHLTYFKFVVGHDVKNITSRVSDHVEFDYNQQGRCLRFVNGKNIPDAVLRTLACTDAFYLDHHLDICSLTNFGVENINGLKFCIISECPKIQTVVDSTELTETVFPSLKNLSIYHLWNLTCIWEGIVPKGSFAELRILSVHACPKLRYVFSSPMIQFVSKLEQLVVEDCPAMEEIIHEGEIIDSSCIMLPNLKKLTLHNLPGLVNIWTSAWSSLEHINFYDCPRLKKIGADSKLVNTIIEIKAEKSWWDALEWEDNELQLQLQNCLTAICEDDL